MTIDNPNLKLAQQRAAYPNLVDGEPDDDMLNLRRRQGRIAVKRMMGAKYTDPARFDQQFESVVKEVQTEVVDIDAKLMEGNRLVHYRSAEAFLRSPTVRRRVEQAIKLRRFTEAEADKASDTLRKRTLEARMGVRAKGTGKLRESAFEMGLYPDEVMSGATGAKKVFPITDVILPSLNSPASKQQLFYDYLDAHRKSFEAATFNPIAKRIIRLVGQFVLGRGVVGTVSSARHQEAWNDFWRRNRMKMRSKQTLRELLVYGEIFWRYFKTPQGLIVRSIDPSTIWDIVTDEDDLEDVKYYHQQYVRLDMSPIPGKVPTPSTLVIRQIPADQITHYKINSTSSEKRGRSELFPILGYLLRFKEFVNDRILLNKMRAMFALDVAVEGDEGDVRAAEEQFSEPPGPAAVLIHNAAVTTEFKNANTNSNDASLDADMLLKVIAIGAGVSESFLGVSRGQTRAGALISTEPDVKNFEEYQELMEELLLDAAVRVFKHKNLPIDLLPGMEFTFPSIAQEDRSAKLKDIAFSESMDYFTKARAAAMAAREFNISDYDYSKEQEAVRKERGQDPVIATGLQQLPKIAPAEPGGEQPGLGQDLQTPKRGENPLKLPGNRVTQTSGEMGFKADLGGRSLPNTRATLNRPNFSRGTEKTAIKNQRTSGTPLRHSGSDAPVSRSGWTPAAREKSLATRRANALKRRQGQE